MLYKEGMICKHFKGINLLEKNIYKIEKLGVVGTDVDQNSITYTGDNNLLSATNLVIYRNIFQENKLFAREYEDISKELSDEKKIMYNQEIKVQPLTEEERIQITDPSFVKEKREFVLRKFKS